MAKILFHTGFSVIEKPDIGHGRKNADFGQGFYLSENEEFSRRWARSRKDEKTYINRYELDDTDLLIKHFIRNKEWFDYIFNNRRMKEDAYKEYDVIIGPIANDTLYDTWGIITSGLLSDNEAEEVMMIGPCYEQTVIKSDKALSKLLFIKADELSAEEIHKYRQIVAKEEGEYQKEFSQTLKSLSD